MKKIKVPVWFYILNLVLFAIFVALGSVLVAKFNIEDFKNAIWWSDYFAKNPESIFKDLGVDGFKFFFAMGIIFIIGSILSLIQGIATGVYFKFEYNDEKIEFKYLKYGLIPTQISVKYNEIHYITKAKRKIKIKLKNESKPHSIGALMEGADAMLSFVQAKLIQNQVANTETVK